MNIKTFQSKKIQLLIIVILIINLIGLLLVLDDEGFFENDNNYQSYPVLSTIDLTILNNAYQEYEELTTTMTPAEARQHLITTLNTQTEGVTNAELGIDGYTIFISYTDGDLAAVDTYDLYENHTQATNTTTTMFTTDWTHNPPPPENQPEIPPILFSDQTTKQTCETKKILVLAPCLWEFPTQPIDDTIQYFKDHGWTDDDMTLKYASIEPYKKDTDCFGISPSDYFNQEDYGIILFIGHGAISARNSFDEDNLYLQFCYVTNESFIANPTLKQWMKDEQLVIIRQHLVNTEDASYFVYSTMIRADLLRQKMTTTLPHSYCYFATCYGTYFNDLYLDKGAKIFLSWNNLVSGKYADANMKNIAQLLLENNLCVLDAYKDTSIIKAYKYSDPNNPIRGVVPAYKRHQRPSYPNVYFYLTPDPTNDTTAATYYMPTWIDLTITNIPYTATTLQTTIYDTDNNLLTQADQSISNINHIELKEVGGLLPPHNTSIIIKTRAYDANGQALAEGETLHTLHAGQTTALVTLQELGESQRWVISGGNKTGLYDAVLIDGGNVCITPHLNGEKIRVYPNQPAPHFSCLDYWSIGFQARSGDTLTIYISSSKDPYGVNHSNGALWIHCADDVSKQLKLCDAMDFGTCTESSTERVVLWQQSFILP